MHMKRAKRRKAVPVNVRYYESIMPIIAVELRYIMSRPKFASNVVSWGTK